MTTPNHPTHAVRHISNCDGEHDVLTSLCVLNEEIGVFYYFNGGKPVLEYVGDEIIHAWALTDQMADTVHNARRYLALRGNGLCMEVDSLDRACWLFSDEIDAAADRLMEGGE